MIELSGGGDVFLTVYALREFGPLEQVWVSLEVAGIGPGGIPFDTILAVRAVQEKAIVQTVEFTSDHNLLRDNRTDFLKSGERFKDVEWNRPDNYNVPITHTRDQKLTLKLGVDLTNIPNGTNFTIRGASSTEAFRFQSGVLQAAGPRQTITLTATNALPSQVQRLEGTIGWFLKLNPGAANEKEISLGNTRHRVYTTFGRPNVGATAGSPEGQPGQQVTEIRINLAVERASAAFEEAVANSGSTNPKVARIVLELTQQHVFNLMKNVAMFTDPVEKGWLVPGSWQQEDANGKKGSDCISGAKFVEAVVKMIGFEGVTIETKAYFAKSVAEPTKAVEGPVPFIERANGKERALLFDSGENHNNFEATIVLTQGDRTLYFPLGAGRLVFDHPDKVLTLFKFFAWSTRVEGTKIWRPIQTDIIHTYTLAASENVDQ